MKCKLSKGAAQDLEDIYLYGFIHFGEAQADTYAETLEKRIEIICANPEIGRMDTRVNPAVRRFESENHVIFYDIDDKHIFIVRILHGATDYVQYL
ncbi:MAG: plasmid stabilization protein [Alphaproteobacteria bacterium]|nr:MAG: plasmid stabilization protein [Alphaproteobacteria bacterium]